MDMYQDFTTAVCHASEPQSATAKHPGCPPAHACCHGHSQQVGVLSDGQEFYFTALPVGFHFDHDDIVIEGPVREIDHPPQLS